ncbi:uncharacterized protein LOC126855398 isoform X2 [Cataglyphis hispanica]|uniref:uncharacterized protein LOC126855398 isoform X2 n=1 Tax=Cataglyphis hispanica TaxID=1086592 RepID=UPI00218009EA|nr:uncharacterized protein LOC126855398 isoform X2 [Cataglyphis hispanica]
MEFRNRLFDVKTDVSSQTKKKQAKKKLRGPDSPLYTSIWPMIYAVRVFGLAPYDFSQDHPVPSNMYLIFTAIAATLYTHLFYVVMKKFFALDRDDKVLEATEDAKVTINYSAAVYELGLTAFKRRSFIRIWNALQDYDEDVRQLGYPRNEKQTAIAAWCVTVMATIIWIAVNRTGMHAFDETWTNNMGYMIIYVGSSIAVYKFVAMAFFLGQRFRHLNMITIKNLPSASENMIIITISKTTILNLHNNLMIAAESLASMYSLSLLLWFANLGLHTVSNLFFIIKWVLENGHDLYPWGSTSWSLICCLGSWLLAFFLQLLLLHIVCHYASFQANRMGIILIEWQVRLMKKNDIAALSSTYLVVLLQFP